MSKYIIKRVLLMIPTLFGAGLLVFCLMRLVPGDICEVKLGGEGATVTEEQLEICREEVGLNKSLPAQFGDFMIGMVTLNPGESMWTGRAIGHEINIRFQLTLQLAIMTTIVSVIIALPLGVIFGGKTEHLDRLPGTYRGGGRRSDPVILVGDHAHLADSHLHPELVRHTVDAAG